MGGVVGTATGRMCEFGCACPDCHRDSNSCDCNLTDSDDHVDLGSGINNLAKSTTDRSNCGSIDSGFYFSAE